MADLSIGQRLRQAREAIPASLVEASRATRVRVDFLEAMERDSFTFISGRVYVRGMLRSYARWLRLDESEISAEFDRLYAPVKAASLSDTLPSRDEPRMLAAKPRKAPWSIVGAAAFGVFVVLLLVSLLHSGSNVAQPPPVPVSPSPSPSVTATSVAPASGVPSGVSLVVAVTKGSSWVHVITGNTIPTLVTFQGVLGPGVTRTFTAPDVLRVDFGNMGAVSLNVNGKDLGAPGALGRNGAFAITPDAALTPDPTAIAQPPPSPAPSQSPPGAGPSPSPSSPPARPSPSPPNAAPTAPQGGASPPPTP